MRGRVIKKKKVLKPVEPTYQSVKQILESARGTACCALNFAMIQAHWNIGRVTVCRKPTRKAKSHALRDELPIIRNELSWITLQAFVKN